ncbi:MAG: NUDIX hydrolase [Clostridia bacterium]|nr:NUDIX hydrolase [Clostridia bacterium]
MSEENLVCEEIRCEHLVQDQWIDFRRSAYRFPDGRVFEPYYSYTRRDYAVIVASDEGGDFLCVRQFRQGLRQVTTEFPAGGIELMDANPESRTQHALAAARRELQEETGFVSDSWEHLLTVPAQATLSDNYAYIFRAKNCRPASGQKLDDMELLKVQKHTADEIEDMISSGRFQQAVHILAWLLAQRQKDGAKNR